MKSFMNTSIITAITTRHVIPTVCRPQLEPYDAVFPIAEVEGSECNAALKRPVAAAVIHGVSWEGHVKLDYALRLSTRDEQLRIQLSCRPLHPTAGSECSGTDYVIRYRKVPELLLRTDLALHTAFHATAPDYHELHSFLGSPLPGLTSCSPYRPQGRWEYVPSSDDPRLLAAERLLRPRNTAAGSWVSDLPVLIRYLPPLLAASLTLYSCDR